jgi:hypothetical protein
MAVREVMAACNEKWIRETARRGNKGFTYLWKNHLFSIRNVAVDPALSGAWTPSAFGVHSSTSKAFWTVSCMSTDSPN